MNVNWDKAEVQTLKQLLRTYYPISRSSCLIAPCLGRPCVQVRRVPEIKMWILNIPLGQLQDQRTNTMHGTDERTCYVEETITHEKVDRGDQEVPNTTEDL